MVPWIQPQFGRGRVSGGGGFDPSLYGTPIEWLEANDTPGGSSLVSLWSKRTYGQDVAQASSPAQPTSVNSAIDGNNAVVFSGSQFLSAAASSGLSGNNYSMFIVATGGGGAGTIAAEDNPSSRGWALRADQFELNGSFVYNYSSSGWGLISIIGGVGLYLNGVFQVAITSAMNSHTGDLFIGERDYPGFNNSYFGSIGSILIFSNQVNSTNQAIIESNFFSQYPSL